MGSTWLIGKKSKTKSCVIVSVSVNTLLFNCKSSSKSGWNESKCFPNVIRQITLATLSIKIFPGLKSLPSSKYSISLITYSEIAFSNNF